MGGGINEEIKNNEERINALEYQIQVLNEIVPLTYDKIKSCEELLCQIWTKLKKR